MKRVCHSTNILNERTFNLHIDNTGRVPRGRRKRASFLKALYLQPQKLEEIIPPFIPIENKQI